MAETEQRQDATKKKIGPILFLNDEESLVSSNSKETDFIILSIELQG